MPRKRKDSRTDDDSSSTSSSSSEESSDSLVSKKTDHRRSKKEHVPRSSPSRDAKYGRDHRDLKGGSSTQRHASSSKHYSSDSSRRRSPFQDTRRGNEKSDVRRRGDKDRHYQNFDNRRDRDMSQKRTGVSKDRIERRQRSRDHENEKSRKAEDVRSVPHSRDKNSRNKGAKEGDNYLSQQTEGERKDKSLSTDTRRVRNDNIVNPAHKSTSTELVKEKEGLRSGLYADIPKEGDRFRKDGKRVVSETNQLKHNKKLKEKKRKVSASSSSSSNSDDSSSSESDSDVGFADSARKDAKRVEGSKQSTTFLIRQPDSDKHVDHTEKSEEGESVVIEKKTENIQKDAVEKIPSRESSASRDEKESIISKHKRGHTEKEENNKNEEYKQLQIEGDFSKIVAAEKQSTVSQEKIILNYNKDDDSEEEKEEGEISEDNEDKIPDKPLKAISDYISDISSDDGQPEPAEPKEVLPQKILHSHPAPMPSHGLSEIAKESEKNTEQLSKSSKAGKTDKKIVASKNKDVADFGNGGGEKRKGIVDFSDREVVDGEDNSKRQRPVLESDDDDSYNRDEGKGTTRSIIQSKQKMGSSVSVVKQKSSRRGDSYVGRDGSRGRGREDSSRRDKRDIDTRSRQDTEREKRWDGSGEKRRDGISDTKRLSDKSEPKDISSTKSTKPDSNTAPKTTEEPSKKPMEAFDITTKTGGAYIPPAKLRMMQELITDKTSVAYQRMSWEALKKSINGLVNKINVSNITNIIIELFQENIVRGRGPLARSVIQAQAASPTFTHVYAALVAIVNTKFPQNGELILRRLILMFRRGFKRNDKALCLSSTTFIAHLVNQQVAHEILALEVLTLLLDNPTDDSVEIAVGFLKECGQKLNEVSPRGMNAMFERLRHILHEGQLDVRVQYMVEVMFAIRKDGFKDHPSVLKELDLVEEELQFTHLLQLEDAVAGDELLNIFKEDPTFAENEDKYKSLKKEILDEGSSDEESGASSGSGSSDGDSEDEEKANAEKQTIIDKTETNLVALRRSIYLTVQSSLDHNECAHKMMKMDLKPGQEVELCNMILDCCAQLRTYEKFFGLLAQRFCQIDKKYIEPFQQIFVEQYDTIHRLETNKLRIVAKIFAHLLHTDAISWGVLSVIKLTEEDTTSASRIFLKILFQELSEYMGLLKLNERLKDPSLSPYFKGILARDNPKNTRFCINFFTTIGLGGLTDDLREHLKTATKLIAQLNDEADQAEKVDSSSDSSSDSSDADSSSDSGSDSQSKRRHKLSASKTKKKTDKETSKSKKKATDKENKRADRHPHKSTDRDSNSQSRSISSSKAGRHMNERNVSPEKGKKTIADRLLDMAQYGNIRNGDERPRERNERDKEKEIRPQFNRRDDDKERRSGRDERDYDKSRENEDGWGQSGKRWNNNEEREGRRQEENMSYGNRSGENGKKRGGRQYEVSSVQKRDDESHQQNDSSWDRRSDTWSGNQKRWRNEFDREDTRRDKVSDAGRGVVPRGEKRKDRRHDSDSEDSESSPEKGRKRPVRGRSLSASPEKRDKKKSSNTDIVQKPVNKKRQYDTSDSKSTDDSSNNNHSKSSRSKKDDRSINSSTSRPDVTQKNKRKKSLSSSGSSSSSSSSSSDEEVVEERRIITKKPRLSGDKEMRRQKVLNERSGENDRVKRRR